MLRPGVKVVEGFSASVAPLFEPSPFSPRVAVEKTIHTVHPCRTPLGALDPAVEGLALDYPPVEVKPFIGAGQAEEQR